MLSGSNKGYIEWFWAGEAIWFNAWDLFFPHLCRKSAMEGQAWKC